MFDDAAVPVVQQPNPVDPQQLTGEQFDRILTSANMIESWIASVKAEAYRRLEMNQDPPRNWKLVKGRMSARAWQDEAVAAEALQKVLPRSKIFTEKMLTPTQVEKVLKKTPKLEVTPAQVLDSLLAERVPGKPAMVPVEDSRPAVPPKIEQMFGEQEN
jgi:hypothetical protein